MAADVKTGAPTHVLSAGAYTLNVMVPVGLTPPARVAVSLTGDPTVVEAVETCVVMEVVAARLVRAKFPEVKLVALATTL
jgi:hypothetical protein